MFLVNLLGIVYDPRTRLILIGKRQDDPYIKELTWTFPGGRPNYEVDLEENLKESIQEKTGLSVSIKGTVFAKTYPEKREFLSIYYRCDATNIGEEKTSEKFTELKWVKPSEVTKYFTTSLHSKLLEYLKALD